jgi:hypothetical protein
LIATEKTYRARGFNLDSTSDIGEEACVHAEALDAPLWDCHLLSLTPRPDDRPPVFSVPVCENTPTEARFHVGLAVRSQRQRVVSRSRGGIRPARVILDSENRHECSMSKGRGDVENERERESDMCFTCHGFILPFRSLLRSFIVHCRSLSHSFLPPFQLNPSEL